MRIRDWTIEGAEGQPIYGTTHLPDGEPRGVLIICHGFKGYKDDGFLPHLARAAADAGLIAHRFNFSHSGVTRRYETFERPDLFEQDTWSKQIKDLRAVVGAVQSGQIAGENLPMVWFGHSRGGVTVLLTASRIFAGPDSAPKFRPVGLVTAAAPHDAAHLDEEQKDMLRKVGRLPSPSARTGQELYVGRQWLEEIESDPEAYDPLTAAKGLPCPVLVVHGEEDETVAPASARGLANAIGEHAILHWIDQASHTFNAPNPLPVDDTPPTATQELIDSVREFALKCCAANRPTGLGG